MAFHDFAKCQKSIGLRTFWSIQKSSQKYLIKPVVYGDFWGPFRKMAPKSIKIALGLSVKVDGVSRLCKSPKKHWSQSIPEHPKKLIEIPYKPYRLWRLWGTFRKMAPKSIKKALGLSVKVDGVSRLCEMSKKHCSQSILEHPKRIIKIPYKTC